MHLWEKSGLENRFDKMGPCLVTAVAYLYRLDVLSVVLLTDQSL